MPTYDYKCQDCKHTFTRVESISAHERARAACPKCRSANVSRVFTSFYAKTVRKS